MLSLALESKNIWRTVAVCLFSSGTPPHVIPGELAIVRKGTGNFSKTRKVASPQLDPLELVPSVAEGRE